MQLGYMRPRNRHSLYHNLYFTGASTHPGTGIPTVLVSARHTATRLLEENGFDRPGAAPKYEKFPAAAQATR